MTKRCGCRWLVVVVSLVAASQAGALTIRPMSDARLLRSSDLVVLGTVEAVRSGDWGGRIVTWVDLRVEEPIKGRVTGDRIRLTEPGGRAGGRRLVFPGVPSYAPGERVVVFARGFGSGLLRTTGLTLGRWVVERAASGSLQARRPLPAAVEPLATLLARLRALGAEVGTGSVPNGFAAGQVAATAPFLIGLPDGQGQLLRGRWVEAECGVPVEYSLGNVDPGLGGPATRVALEQALAAWSAPMDGAITLAVGPDLPITTDEFFWANTVVFEDPFDEIVDDLVGCQGVLAIGGFFAEDAGNPIERIVQGIIVMNQGVSACLDAVGVAETLAHEVGHTIGFGHSSEDPLESNPVLADALMYFLIHDDGRGARLGTDDLAALATLYPRLPPTDPITDGLSEFACLFQLGPFGGGCGYEALVAQQNGQGLRVRAAPSRKFRKGARRAEKAATAPNPKKQGKLVRKARSLAIKSDAAATRLFDRGKYPAGCFDDLHEATDRVVRKADALVPILDAGG